jgi:hypothetical protein
MKREIFKLKKKKLATIGILTSQIAFQQHSSESQRENWKFEIISEPAACKTKHEIYIQTDGTNHSLKGTHSTLRFKGFPLMHNDSCRPPQHKTQQLHTSLTQSIHTPQE